MGPPAPGRVYPEAGPGWHTPAREPGVWKTVLDSGSEGRRELGACSPGVPVPLSWWVPLFSLVGSLGPIRSPAFRPALEFGSFQPSPERGAGREAGG